MATGAGGAQLALWQQGGVMAAALRGGAGSAWGATETAGASPARSQPYGADHRGRRARRRVGLGLAQTGAVDAARIARAARGIRSSSSAGRPGAGSPA